jgi:hypothetical protein
MGRLFQGTTMSPEKLFVATEKIARASVLKAGGRIEKDAAGEEFFVIPVQTPKPSPLEQCWEPGPIANSKFDADELKRITVSMGGAVEQFAPGWTIANCGPDMDPGLHADELGKTNVLVTHPLDRNTACVLSKPMEIPTGKTTTLHLTVGHHPQGDWELIVRADGKELFRKAVSKSTTKKCWMDASVDLTPLAGKEINLELLNQPTGWNCEAGYWAKVDVESK